MVNAAPSMLGQSPNDTEVLAEVKMHVVAGRIRWRHHALEQMADRGFEKSQVTECLKRGHFTERPTVPNRGGEIEFSFRMEARVDGELIAVAGSLVPERFVKVITVFEPT